MNQILIGATLTLALATTLSLYRVLRGPTIFDRLTGLGLIGTKTIVLLVLLGFLTDRVGWIVGGGTTPYTRQGYGVVLFTDDGGVTWQQPATDPLPRLHWV